MFTAHLQYFLLSFFSNKSSMQYPKYSKFSYLSPINFYKKFHQFIVYTFNQKSMTKIISRISRSTDFF